MANIKSQKKRNLTNAKHERNKATKSELKTPRHGHAEGLCGPLGAGIRWRCRRP